MAAAVIIHGSYSPGSSPAALVPFTSSPRPILPLPRHTLSSSSSTPLHFPSLRCTTSSVNTNLHKSFNRRSSSSNAGISGSSSRRVLALARSSGKYIREDYLVKKVSAEEMKELVKGERRVPLVVDFYATWCGPCILMAQELEMLAVEYENNVLFVKVDTDDEYEFARDMQVRGLPTLYFISPDPSKDAIRTEGLVPPEMIKNIIDNEM